MAKIAPAGVQLNSNFSLSLLAGNYGPCSLQTAIHAEAINTKLPASTKV
jgi:hypothetical protein